MLAYPDVTRRPGLAYQHAFDWLAMRLSRKSMESTACMVREPWQLLQLLERLPNVAVLEPESKRRELVSQALGLTPLAIDMDEVTHAVTAVAIVEPAPDQADVIARLFRSMQFGSRMHIVTHGLLARFLAEQRASDQESTLSVDTLKSLADAFGYCITEQLGMHPPAAVREHYGGVLASKVGRHSARDRRHFAMRRSMVVNGRTASFSALVCLTMERLT